MTSKQFARTRKRLWRTQAQAAEALGVTPGQISHLETGRRPIPKIIIQFLACLESSKIHPTA